MDLYLNQKKAVVTGASQGIGRITGSVMVVDGGFRHYPF